MGILLGQQGVHVSEHLWAFHYMCLIRTTSNVLPLTSQNSWLKTSGKSKLILIKAAREKRKGDMIEKLATESLYVLTTKAKLALGRIEMYVVFF